MTSNRISTYTAWKRKNIEEMLEPITAIAKTMVHELLKVRENYKDPDLSVTSVTYALQQLQPSDQEPNESIPETLAEGYLNDVANILEAFKGSTGLTLLRADNALDHFAGEDIWGCKAHFSCPPWQQLFEGRLGFPADITIEVSFDDYEPWLVAVPAAAYMELADLLVLRAAADEFWAEPLTWATLRANGC